MWKTPPNLPVSLYSRFPKPFASRPCCMKRGACVRVYVVSSLTTRFSSFRAELMSTKKEKSLIIKTRHSPHLVQRDTCKQHLAGVRHFFDGMVTRHAVILNPALSVRGERYEVVEGKTPELSVAQARLLLKSMKTSGVLSRRDRAILAILAYTSSRAGRRLQVAPRRFLRRRRPSMDAALRRERRQVPRDPGPPRSAADETGTKILNKRVCKGIFE